MNASSNEGPTELQQDDRLRARLEVRAAMRSAVCDVMRRHHITISALARRAGHPRTSTRDRVREGRVTLDELVALADVTRTMPSDIFRALEASMEANR